MKSLFEEAKNLFNEGNLEQSKKICQKILETNPKDIDALILISVIAFKTNHNKKSLEIIEYALKLYPNTPEFYFNKAHVLFEQEDFENSLDCINKSISLKNNYYEGYNLKGLILLKKKQEIYAIESFRKAIKINPKFFEAYKNLFVLYKNNKQKNNAIKIIDEAINVLKNYHELYWLKSTIYSDEKKFDEAIIELNKAIQFNPNISETFNLRGIIYKEIRKYNEALKDFNEAIKLDSKNLNAYHNLGNLLKKHKKIKEALNCYKKAIEINQFYKNGLGNYLATKNSICDWENYDSDSNNLKKLIQSKKNVCSTFNSFSIIDSSELHLVNAKLENDDYLKNSYYNNKLLLTKKKKIKIAYYSADFYNHPVSNHIVELIEKHDRNKFEIIGFSFNSVQDRTKERLISAFDKFIDVEKKSIDEIINLSKKLEIDIAIDLMGYTENNRFLIFENRCAPIQINFLGFAGTTGSKNMDYIIADNSVINKTEIINYSEKIIYLPTSFMVTDTKRKPSKQLFNYKNYEFPMDSIILCNLNKYYKITPKIFNIWCNILRKFEKTVLWLSADNLSGSENLIKEIEKKGIDKNRLFFAKFENKTEDHLARIKLANLCLDTYPYGSHTIGYDYLAAGVPFVTLKGNSFASKVSTSMLESMNLQELITHSFVDYEKKIIDLITSPEKLLELKKKLEINKTQSNLFNINSYKENLEKSYEIVYTNKLKGLPVSNITID